jgi:hypothetical protein
MQINVTSVVNISYDIRGKIFLLDEQMKDKCRGHLSEINKWIQVSLIIFSVGVQLRFFFFMSSPELWLEVRTLFMIIG